MHWHLHRRWTICMCVSLSSASLQWEMIIKLHWTSHLRFSWHCVLSAWSALENRHSIWSGRRRQDPFSFCTTRAARELKYLRICMSIQQGGKIITEYYFESPKILNLGRGVHIDRRTMRSRGQFSSIICFSTRFSSMCQNIFWRYLETLVDVFNPLFLKIF